MQAERSVQRPHASYGDLSAPQPLISRAHHRCMLIADIVMIASSVLSGVEVGIGSTVAAVGPSTHSSLHVTGAVLVPEVGTVTNAFADVAFLLTANTDAGKIVVASLAPSRPNIALQLVSALRSSKLTLTVTAVGAQAATATGYKVSFYGYTSAAATGSATAAAAPQQKRKEVESASKPAQQQQPAKKQKVEVKAEPEEEEDEDEDDDEEAATPVKSAPKSKPASPATPSASDKPKKASVVSLANGLKLQDTKIGQGKEAIEKSAVGIRYRGSLASNGKVRR